MEADSPLAPELAVRHGGKGVQIQPQTLAAMAPGPTHGATHRIDPEKDCRLTLFSVHLDSAQPPRPTPPTCCMLYVLALYVNTYCMWYLDIVLVNVAPYPSCLCCTRELG